MTTALSPPDPSTVAVPTEDARLDLVFADLVCSDDDLLAAEFEAIVTASWAGPVLPGAVLVRTGPGRSADAGLGATAALIPGHEEWSAEECVGRQRSPPLS